MTDSEIITTNVVRAAEVLRDGGIIGMPTETVYGLAAVALNESAVNKVFTTKGRPKDHPLIVHLASLEQCLDWGVFPPSAHALATAFWPGPLTLLVERTQLVPNWVTGNRDTVALRVPRHELTLQLLRLVDTGVVAPSANKFGKVSPTTAEHVLADLGDDVDLILDGGICDVGLESTIVECIGSSVKILRPGAITATDVASVVGDLPFLDSSNSRAPGMLASHYSPNAQVLLCSELEDAREQLENFRSQGLIARIVWHEDVIEYAEQLYSDLRQADTDGCQVVIAVLPQSDGVGLAIRDRLTKAAHHD
ncbi:MAG: L-threonylcarbamoyladenylate synthase [Acidimicrobiaceae bacterium]